MQKRQTQSNSKSRSEKFNPHQEDVASGFPIDPPRPSQAVEGSTQEHYHKRASHSGPLTHRAAWAKAGKNLDDAAKISTGTDLSTISGFVEARRMSEDRRQRSSSSQPEVAKFVGRFPGSFKEASESVTQHDEKLEIAGSHKKEDSKTGSKDPILVSSLIFHV